MGGLSHSICRSVLTLPGQHRTKVRRLFRAFGLAPTAWQHCNAQCDMCVREAMVNVLLIVSNTISRAASAVSRRLYIVGAPGHSGPQLAQERLRSRSNGWTTTAAGQNLDDVIQRSPATHPPTVKAPRCSLAGVEQNKNPIRSVAVGGYAVAIGLAVKPLPNQQERATLVVQPGSGTRALVPNAPFCQIAIYLPHCCGYTALR